MAYMEHLIHFHNACNFCLQPYHQEVHKAVFRNEVSARNYGNIIKILKYHEKFQIFHDVSGIFVWHLAILE